VSAGWTVLGPVNWDDAWYSLMARNAGESGYVGNYIYMFNATENPFVASQYLLQAWGAIGGWGLPWLRLLPLLYGLATWALLRMLLTIALGPSTSTHPARSRTVPWVLLVAYLLWWLPYGMMLRPEPLIAMCAAGVLLLAEVARRRRSLGMLAGATAVATLALTASPSGLVAGAPLVVALPWLLRELRERGWVERVAAVLVVGAASTVVVPIGFADASLGEVLDAAATHTWYYRSFAWYEEIVHYDYLLLTADTGVWGRRAPVVLTLAVLVIVAIGGDRRRLLGDPVRRLVLTGALTAITAFALLSVTPTKWVNHFGALSAAGTVLLTAALLRSPLPGRAGATARSAAVLVVAGAAALTFAGPNLWRPYSDWGQPFGNHQLANGTPYEVGLMAPNIGPVYLRSPLVWLGVAAVIAVVILWWRRRGRHTSLTSDQGLLLAVSAFSVALMLAVFGYAPLRQYPGWTVALSNARALAGEPCGLGAAVQVLRPSGPQPEPAAAAPLQSGDFVLADGFPAPVPVPWAGAAVWHDEVPPERDYTALQRGTIVTPWFALPASDATHLSVPVAAGAVAGQVVRVQFGSGTLENPEPGRTVTLALDDRVDVAGWQEVPVPLERVRPALVRILAEDVVSAAGSWLAVASPSLASWQPVETVTANHPVFADQLSAPLWPCVDQVAIRRGIVEAPSVRLLADDGIPEFVLVNPWDPLWGGTLVQSGYTATAVRMASRIAPAGPSTRPWGRVERIVRDHPVGLVDLRVEPSTEAGWQRRPPITGETYSGRQYLG
ncbi:MAG: arabinosyltransferase, partial [Actinomycetota bacterium]|nr:arabinosyltransferase [Actinomycetota bacterium]